MSSGFWAFMASVTRKSAASGKRQDELACIAAIKTHVGPASFRFSDAQLLRLVKITGSVGLACDALCMIPQPKFLQSL